ncbi:fibronectin type III domain-containing protein [Desertimonas flava]|uniref:fibronectin type III domain-containing protein n=1 Tax=Desertimonas flava TaxID=2064846 RepID=UPI000E34A127|nr:fibronectin type III domain-containing protein [Desertimonas flava]
MFVTLRRAAVRRALAAVVAAAGALVSPLAAAAGPSLESPSAPAFALAPALPSSTSLRDVTNSYRASAGVAGLTLNAALNQAAQIRAQEMVANGYFAHRRPNGTSPSTVLAQVGYGWNAWGENLFMSSYDPAPSSVVGAWMNSSGHRANMLSSTFTQVGFGSATTPNFAGQGPRTIVVAIYARPSGTVVLQRPSAPLSFTASSPGPGQVRLSWAAPSWNGGAAIAQYGFQRSSNGGASWIGGNAGGGSSRSVLISGLTPGAGYRFRLAARNSVGWGSMTASVIVYAAPRTPSAPTSLSATALPSGEVRLDWTAPAYNGGAAITQYGYQRSSDGGRTWVGGNGGGPSSRSVLLRGLTPGVAWQFRVAARNSAGWGAMSPVASARPVAPFSATSLLVATAVPTTTAGTTTIVATTTSAAPPITAETSSTSSSAPPSPSSTEPPSTDPPSTVPPSPPSTDEPQSSEPASSPPASTDSETPQASNPHVG